MEPPPAHPLLPPPLEELEPPEDDEVEPPLLPPPLLLVLLLVPPEEDEVEPLLLPPPLLLLLVLPDVPPLEEVEPPLLLPDVPLLEEVEPPLLLLAVCREEVEPRSSSTASAAQPASAPSEVRSARPPATRRTVRRKGAMNRVRWDVWIDMKGSVRFDVPPRAQRLRLGGFPRSPGDPQSSDHAYLRHRSDHQKQRDNRPRGCCVEAAGLLLRNMDGEERHRISRAIPA